MKKSLHEIVRRTRGRDSGDIVLGERLQWATDSAAEYAGEGYDIVMSSASFTLSADVEELRLTFDANTAVTDPQFYADLMAYGQDGTGNDLANTTNSAVCIVLHRRIKREAANDSMPLAA